MKGEKECGRARQRVLDQQRRELEGGWFPLVHLLHFISSSSIYRLFLELDEGLVADLVRIMTVLRNTIPRNITVLSTDCGLFPLQAPPPASHAPREHTTPPQVLSQWYSHTKRTIFGDIEIISTVDVEQLATLLAMYLKIQIHSYPWPNSGTLKQNC
jgi:hypothetical protein